MNNKRDFTNNGARHKPDDKSRQTRPQYALAQLSRGPAKPRPASTSRTEMSSLLTYEFFLICQPGFENLVIAELESWNLSLNPRPERGGVTVTATLADGFALNQILRIPNRILLRLADFGCRDFPKLYKKMAAFPWENWLPFKQNVIFSASSSNSWLKIKKRIEETASEGRRSRLKATAKTSPSASFEIQRGAPIEVHIRFADDVCTVSLDTSGEILHKRGQRPLSSAAPLRESTAAALLRLMIRQSRNSGPRELVDPMTGSGTFLLEAAIMNRQLVDRDFAFKHFSQIIMPTRFSEDERNMFTGLIGFDRDSRVIRAAQENLTQVRGTAQVNLRAEDFLTAEALPSGQERWLIANPPYGERIAITEPLKPFYESLLEAAERVAHPSVSCFIFPESVVPAKLRHPANWQMTEQLKFSNGGIPVVAQCYVSRSD